MLTQRSDVHGGRAVDPEQRRGRPMPRAVHPVARRASCCSGAWAWASGRPAVLLGARAVASGASAWGAVTTSSYTSATLPRSAGWLARYLRPGPSRHKDLRNRRGLRVVPCRQGRPRPCLPRRCRGHARPRCRGPSNWCERCSSFRDSGAAGTYAQHVTRERCCSRRARGAKCCGASCCSARARGRQAGRGVLGARAVAPRERAAGSAVVLLGARAVAPRERAASGRLLASWCSARARESGSRAALHF